MAAIANLDEATFQAICDVLGDTNTGLTGSEIGRYLKECGSSDPKADLILATTDLPEGRAVRYRELLRSALALTGDLIGQAKLPAAALLGRKGGSQTSKR